VPRGLEPSWRDWRRVGRISEAAAARRNERELDRFLYGREGRGSARVGINPAEGRPLSFDTDFTSVIDKIMV